MAQKIQILLTDDLDGSEAQETVTFGLDGRTYEIDLNEKNNDKLRKFLDPYVKAGRRAGGKATRGAGQRASSAGSSDSGKIREWAKAHGHTVNDRGRIPAEIREAYEQANA
ncbi:Lsr2 family protein [Streptomyces sp. CFMR 7]|uniref:histone-like nucleoid-structuring protein Lsr2 n=1 Tax=Streptomyces sp. CFMR 7 TaxID=1649184 RepID=UPI00119D29A6|nr:Lsr2 family protein [Streptomyces sp. CFMR 7]